MTPDDKQQPLQPDILAHYDRLAAEADVRGAKLAKSVRYLREDGTSTVLYLSCDQMDWIERIFRERVNRLNRTWEKRVGKIIAQLEDLAESHS